jgi:lipoate-protein ligase B
VLLIDLPRTGYQEAVELQTAAVRQCVQCGGPDVLIVLEHPPTITLGTRGDEADLLVSAEEVARRGIALHRVDRGGAATFHGPGQLVCYPIVRFRAWKLTVRAYVHGLEETVIRTLDRFGVTGVRVPKHAGVWVGEHRKIASVGVKITRGVTCHGFSLNVNLRIDPCGLVVSCGMPQVRAVSLTDLVGPVEERLVRDALVQSFATVFRVRVERASPAEALTTPRDP